MKVKSDTAVYKLERTFFFLMIQKLSENMQVRGSAGSVVIESSAE